MRLYAIFCPNHTPISLLFSGLDDLAKQYKIEYAPLKGGATETYAVLFCVHSATALFYFPLLHWFQLLPTNGRDRGKFLQVSFVVFRKNSPLSLLIIHGNE